MDIEQQDALIEELRESMETDGVITMEGLKVLFDNKNKIMEEGTTTIEFDDFFADTILEWVGDELDEAKADTLIQLMSDDIDDSEDALLEYLADAELSEEITICDKFKDHFSDKGYF